MSKNTRDLSRRKLLGALGVAGGASALGGAATSALLWDEEKFGNASDPNVLQAGEIDLKVGWEAEYYGGGRALVNDEFVDATSADEPDANADDVLDDPGAIVLLRNVVPGDVFEATLSAHLYGNPGFLGLNNDEYADTENPPSNNPESKAEADADVTTLDGIGGETDDYTQAVIWYDDGDNRPVEVWDGSFSIDAVRDEQDATDAVVNNDQLIYAGDIDGIPEQLLLDPRDSVAAAIAADFPSSACYQPSITESIGVLLWVPRDIEGVNDNNVQIDDIELEIGFQAVQCRHNVADDGTPLDLFPGDEDADGVVGGEESPDSVLLVDDDTHLIRVPTPDDQVGNSLDQVTVDYSGTTDVSNVDQGDVVAGVDRDGSGILDETSNVDAASGSNSGSTLTVDLDSSISLQDGDVVVLEYSDVQTTSTGDTADVSINGSAAASVGPVQ